MEFHDIEDAFGDLVQLAIDVDVGLAELTSAEIFHSWYLDSPEPIFELAKWRETSGEARVSGRDHMGRFIANPDLADSEGDTEGDPLIPRPLLMS